jgi:hypothetical protein
MKMQNVTVGLFDTHDQAEEAIKELKNSGFDMKKLSIIGKDFHTEEHVVGYYNTGDWVKFWGHVPRPQGRKSGCDRWCIVKGQYQDTHLVTTV